MDLRHHPFAHSKKKAFDTFSPVIIRESRIIVKPSMFFYLDVWAHKTKLYNNGNMTMQQCKARCQSRYKMYTTPKHSIELSCLHPEALHGLPILNGCFATRLIFPVDDWQIRGSEFVNCYMCLTDYWFRQGISAILVSGQGHLVIRTSHTYFPTEVCLPFVQSNRPNKICIRKGGHFLHEKC